MGALDDFAVDDRAELTADQVAAELVRHQERGYQVTRSADGSRLVIALDEFNEIRIIRKGFQVQGYRLNSIRSFENPRDLGEFQRIVDSVAEELIGSRWGHHPVSGRTSASTPASNFATIAGLVGTSEVQAIYDPYLDNDGLMNLATAISFKTGAMASSIRAISTNQTTKGTNPRLTRPGFDAWLRQYATAGELRITGSRAHRRFLLLSSGQSLITGQSWNQLHKDEAVRVEDDAQDRTFFDSEWASATPLV